MPTITLSKDEIEEASYRCSNNIGIKLVEQSPWIHSSLKYEVQTTIFEIDGKYYRWVQGRSGSSFLNWHYTDEYDDEAILHEVKKVEVVTTTWKEID